RVRSNPHAVARSLLDHCTQLLLRVLLRADRSLHRQHTRRRTRLDDLGTVLDLVADRLHHLPRSVRYTVLDVLLEDARCVARDITVPAGDAQRVARGDDVRPDHVTTFDRLP